MKAAEQLIEMRALQEQATRLSQHVGTRLKAGLPPTQLIPLLQEQAGVIARLQNRLMDFTPEGPPASRARIRQDVDRLKADFKHLVKTTGENHRLAAQKGVRLTGIGGKPFRASGVGNRGSKQRTTNHEPRT